MADFLSHGGRIGRLEFCFKSLGVSVVGVGGGALFFEGMQACGVDYAVSFLTALGIFGITGLVQVILVIQRLHDTDKPGYYSLALFLPCVNNLLILWALFVPGTNGPNTYGPNPRNASGAPTGV